MDFKDKKILIMGLGLNGGGVEDALFFIKQGAEVTITDLRDEKTLKPSLKKLEGFDIKYTLGKHDEDDFKNKDIIIKNPAVPNDSHFLKIAKKMGAQIDTSIGIFFEHANMSRLVGVTGTKGKSSTTALIHEIIKLEHENTYLGGNIGISPIKYLEKSKDSWGVLELSSYQIEGIAQKNLSPHIAVITNIEEDHLDRYDSYNHYRETKKLIFKNQSNRDYLVLNYDDEYLKSASKEANSNVYFYSRNTRPKAEHAESVNMGAYVYKNKLYVGKKKIGKLDSLGLADTHHYLENMLAALTVANILKIDIKKAISAMLNFNGLPGRLEYLDVIENIKIYNNTTATNPFAVIRSIEKFSNKKMGIILGGEDKDLSFEQLAHKLPDVYTIALLPGSASDKILEAMKKNNIDSKNLQKTATLREALWWCYAKSPDIIMLSPGAASFNMFKNEFDRGDKFIEEVKKFKEIISKN